MLGSRENPVQPDSSVRITLVTVSTDANEPSFNTFATHSHNWTSASSENRDGEKKPRGLLNKVDVDSLRNEGVYNLRGKQMEGQTSASKVRDRSRRGRGGGGTV